MTLSQQANGRRYLGFAVLFFLALAVLLVSGIWGAWAFFDGKDYTIDLPLNRPPDAGDDEPFEFSAAQGDEIELTLEGHSLGGNWAVDDGFFLVFGKNLREIQEPGAAQDGTRIVEPREDDWGDEILTSTRSSSDFEIEADFEVPDLGRSPGETIEGWITGHLRWPVRVSDNEFSNNHVTLYLPITLHVVSAAEAAALARDHYDTQLIVAGATLPVVVFLLVVGVAIETEKDAMTKAKLTATSRGPVAPPPIPRRN